MRRLPQLRGGRLRRRRPSFRQEGDLVLTSKLAVPPPLPGGQIGPPDFVGVGVQRAGTSWWYSLLAAHPEVFHRDDVPKERQFFAGYWNAPFEDGDVARYHQWFARPEGLRTGEWTPRYLYDFWTPPLLHRCAPDTKILVMLRDPVDRYLSGLTHELRRPALQRPDMASAAFQRGLYAQQLQNLLRYYPREQVLVLLFEACRDHGARELATTYRFLGVDDSHVPDELSLPRNRARRDKPVLDEGNRRALVAAYADDVARLAALCPELDLGRWATPRS